MNDMLQAEIDKNYDFLQRNLAALMPDYSGKFALLRSGSVIGFFDGPGEAYRAGLKNFPMSCFRFSK